MGDEKRVTKSAGDDGVPAPTYLDGGWGWVVVLASFLSQTLIGSVYFGYGVLLPEWMGEFQSSSALTSLVGSTASGVISCSGPVASFFILKWGCRATHVVGGVLMTSAFISCYFATSMTQIFVLYSIIAGFGGGLCYVPGIIVISQFFKKRRSVVIGIVAAGCGCGSFLFPVVFEYLMQHFDWRGVMLIAGAFNGNMIACGLVMCPVEKAPTLSCACDGGIEKDLEDPEESVDRRSKSSDEHRPELDVNANYSKGEKYLEVIEEVVGEKEVLRFEHNKRRRSSFQIMRAWLRHPMMRRKSSLMRTSRQDIEEARFQNGNDDVFINDKMDAAPDEGAAQTKLIPSDARPTPGAMTFYQQTKLLAGRRDFYVMLFHNITMFLGMMIVFGLTPLRLVTDFNMTAQQGALLLSVTGVSNLAGRFLWGFVSAFKWLDTTTFFISLRLSAAALTLASPFASSFEAQFAFCALVGAMFGCWSIYPVVVADQFGDGILSVVFGYLEAANGVGSVLGPLLGGYLFDVYGTYQYSFLSAGTFLAVGVIPLAVTHAIAKCKSNAH